MSSDPYDLPPPWRVALAVLFAVVSWPVWSVVRLARWLRFWRIASLARGWKCTLTDDGIEARKNAGPALHVSWEELAQARWIMHSEREMEGWDTEHLAVCLSSRGIALSEQSGELHVILRALERRSMTPRLANGGDSFTLLDTLLMIGWGIAGGVLIVYGLSGGFR